MASSLKRQPDRLPTISPVLTPISNPSDMLGLNFQSFEVPVDKKPKIGTLYKIDIPDGLRSLSDRPKHRLEKTVRFSNIRKHFLIHYSRMKCSMKYV